MMVSDRDTMTGLSFGTSAMPTVCIVTAVLVESTLLTLVKPRDETPGPCIDHQCAGMRLADASQMNPSIVTLACLHSHARLESRLRSGTICGRFGNYLALN